MMLFISHKVMDLGCRGREYFMETALEPSGERHSLQASNGFFERRNRRDEEKSEYVEASHFHY